MLSILFMLFMLSTLNTLNDVSETLRQKLTSSLGNFHTPGFPAGKDHLFDSFSHIYNRILSAMTYR